MKTNLIGPQRNPAALTGGLKLGDQLRQFAQAVGEEMDKVHREVTLKLFINILFDTPVLHGFARGSWRASVGQSQFGPHNRADPTGNAVMVEMMENLPVDHTQISYFSSSIPYILPLEYGWSRKQPEGMVRKNVARFQRIVDEAIKGGGA